MYIGEKEIKFTTHSTLSCSTQFQVKTDNAQDSYLITASLILGSFPITLNVQDFVKGYTSETDHTFEVQEPKAAEIRLSSPIMATVTFTGMQQSAEIQFTIETTDITYYAVEGFFVRTELYSSLDQEFVVLTSFDRAKAEEVLASAGTYKVVQYRLIV